MIEETFRKIVREELERMFGNGRIEVADNTSDDMYTAVSQALGKMGIRPHLLGYPYLRFAVIEVIQDPTMLHNMVELLYPIIAESFQTTPSRVERAMRHAIEKAWQQENADIKHGFPHRKPTNGEFIARLADKIAIARRNAS